MNETLTIVFIVLVAVLVSLIGLALVRRMVPINELEQHTDVAGYVYAVIGVIYAVVLALVVIAGVGGVPGRPGGGRRRSERRAQPGAGREWMANRRSRRGRVRPHRLRETCRQ